jgi:hypothetical protein
VTRSTFRLKSRGVHGARCGIARQDGKWSSLAAAGRHVEISLLETGASEWRIRELVTSSADVIHLAACGRQAFNPASIVSLNVCCIVRSSFFFQVLIAAAVCTKAGKSEFAKRPCVTPLPYACLVLIVSPGCAKLIT